MTTSIDTNVLVALWDTDEKLNSIAAAALDESRQAGGLVVCAPVYAELPAAPQRTDAFLSKFFRDTGIAIDWSFEEPIWRAAGEAFRAYAVRRRKQPSNGPRRILADFLIGAHALHHGHRLLTLDDGIYSSAFPALKLIRL